MKRSEFLKGLGLVGIGSMVPLNKGKAITTKTNGSMLYDGVDCVLIPQETEGPYPLNLSGDSTKFRQDVTEGGDGIPLWVKFTVVNINDNCKPISNARIDIWHTDKDGVYSGFQQPGHNTVGQTFMRGIQLTDSNGQAEFHTIYPGWYSGRITHIHFQVFLNSVLKATSQGAFPDALNTTVYNTPKYATKGQNTSVANNAADSVFASPVSDLQYELFTITDNGTTGGYDAALTVGINAPVSGIINLEPETGGQFKLQQNYPNPFNDTTAITFALTQSSHVDLRVFDLSANEVVVLTKERMSAGDHRVEWDRTVLGRAVTAGNYVYQLSVENSAGTFHQAKVMTVTS